MANFFNRFWSAVKSCVGAKSLLHFLLWAVLTVVMVVASLNNCAHVVGQYVNQHTVTDVTINHNLTFKNLTSGTLCVPYRYEMVLTAAMKEFHGIEEYQRIRNATTEERWMYRNFSKTITELAINLTKEEILSFDKEGSWTGSQNSHLDALYITDTSTVSFE